MANELLHGSSPGAVHLNKRPVLAAALEGLLKLTLSDAVEIPTGEGWQGTHCSICLGDYQERDIIVVLPCAHYFHQECAQTTFCSLQPLCPLCRAGIFDEETSANVRREFRDIEAEETDSDVDNDEDQDADALLNQLFDVVEATEDTIHELREKAHIATKAKDRTQAALFKELLPLLYTAVRQFKHLYHTDREQLQGRIVAVAQEMPLGPTVRLFPNDDTTPYLKVIYFAVAILSAAYALPLSFQAGGPQWPLDEAYLASVRSRSAEVPDDVPDPWADSDSEEDEPDDEMEDVENSDDDGDEDYDPDIAEEMDMD